MKNSHVKRSVRWMVTALALAITGCAEGGSPTGGTEGGSPTGGSDDVGDDPTGGGPVATTAVDVSLMGFAPQDIIVASGAEVTWTWTDAGPHNVTFTDPSMVVSQSQTGGDYKITIPPAPGWLFTYRCTIHDHSGSIYVQ